MYIIAIFAFMYHYRILHYLHLQNKNYHIIRPYAILSSASVPSYFPSSNELNEPSYCHAFNEGNSPWSCLPVPGTADRPRGYHTNPPKTTPPHPPPPPPPHKKKNRKH